MCRSGVLAAIIIYLQIAPGTALLQEGPGQNHTSVEAIASPERSASTFSYSST
jgi:hypothetical protein